mmetsp:Transcript_22824/g.65867  ORF Transcript_22824/g.65867 Transcript_22824/m.65867 type:complete len:365 (+) Transcript_22824:89-1183(+)
MSGAQVRWGVIGCAEIAAKTCHGIAHAENASVVAVGSRTLDKSTDFVNAHAKGAKPYGSYDAVLTDESVQAVYIPLPTALRLEWVKKAAAAKKHILSEKPVAANYQDAVEALRVCRDNGVQFMDNTMLMHHPRLVQMKRAISSEHFGKVRHVSASFTIPLGNDPAWASSNIRMHASTEPLGALGDLGWYSIRMSLWAFDWELPHDVSCHYLETTPDGVPVIVHCVMRFYDAEDKDAVRRSASFDASFKWCLRQSMEIVGETQSLTLDDFVVNSSPESSSFAVCQASMGERHLTFSKSTETHSQGQRIQHASLIETVSGLIQSGVVDEDWYTWTLKTQQVLFACHQSGQRDGAWVNVSDVRSDMR